MLRRLFASLFALSLVAACGGGGTVTPGGDDTASEDALFADGLAPDLTPADAVDPLDTTPPEDAADSSVPLDVIFADQVPMEIFDPCDDPPLGFGCPCSQDAQCTDGHCVQSWTGKVCTSECVEECPEGFSCSLIIGTCPDCQYLCMPLFVHLCRPCLTNNECMGGEVATSDLCVDFGAEGMFCGSACSGAVGCPDGYSCKSVDVAGGIKSYQCVPDDGMCECSDAAIAQGASTSCSQTNEYGTCPGTRTCTAEGLSDCDAAVAAAEICNALDDNCSGVADEEIGFQPCFNENAHGSCQGTELCVGGLTICDAPQATVEVCDGKDNDCDGAIDENSPDTDGDGLADCVDEDDDNDLVFDGLDNCPLIYNPPQADNDFDMAGDACDPDDDNDLVQDSEDCQPFDPASHPGAQEICDGKDNDCDLWTDESTCIDGNACTADICDPVLGCLNPAVDLPCDDGNPCTAPDSCVEGTCTGGGDICPCQEDEDCAALGYVGGCLGALYCDADTLPTVCKLDPAQAEPCPLSDDPCAAAVCDPATGDCLVTAVPDGVPCDDGDPCTVLDHCDAGACTGGPAAVCDDGNPCTQDACNPAAGCTFSLLGAVPCDDGDPCSSGETCATGVCGGGAPVTCDDGNPCTADACQAPWGCVHTPADGLCDDGNACTAGDACLQGSCQGLDPVTCDDGEACTLDTCLPASGCLHSAQDVPCSDGNACTLNDGCVAGACVGTGQPDCSDGNPCTDDLCQADAGCMNPPNVLPCDDGDACTLGDVCGGGLCAGPVTLDCDDDDACTDDACDGVQGCVHTLNTDFLTDEQNCGQCGEVCPEYTVCEGGDCLLLAGRPCTGDGDCLSGACRLDWDLAGSFCAQDGVSCVYALEGVTATQVSPGASMCGGTNGYRTCSAGAWGPAFACSEAGCAVSVWTAGQACVDGDGCTPDPAVETDCSPYVCDGGGCLDACVTDDHCVDGFMCQGGGCIQGNVNTPGSILAGSEFFGPSIPGWVQCAGWTNTTAWDILTTNWIHSCAATSGQLRFRLHNAANAVVLDETFPYWTQSEMSNNLPGCNDSGYGTCGKAGTGGKAILIYKPFNGNGGCHGDDNSNGAVRIANSTDGSASMGDNYVFLGGKIPSGYRDHNFGDTPTSEIRYMNGSLWDGCNHDGRVTGFSIAVYKTE